MSNICPICRTEFAKDKCESCGFEMPAFAFLSEDDANEWYKKSLEDYKKKSYCKNCGKELQEDWKLCPFCGTPAKSRKNSPVFSSLQLVRTVAGHKGNVLSARFSPDGKFIASYSSDKTLKLWEVKGGWLIRTIENIKSYAFSPDGKHIVSAEEGYTTDYTLELWEVESGRGVSTFHGHIVSKIVAFSPDGKHIVSTAANYPFELWEVQNNRLVRTFGDKGSDFSLIFSPDNKYIFSWPRLWEVESGQLVRTFTGHTGNVGSSAFSPDGKYIVAGSNNGILNQWETESGRLRPIEGNVGWVSFQCSPDGKYMVSVSEDDKTLKLWEAESGRFIHEFKDDGVLLPSSVAFSQDGNYIVSGSDNGTLKLWKTESGQCVHTIVGHKNRVNSVAFSPDGKYIVSGSYDGTLKLWELV